MKKLKYIIDNIFEQYDKNKNGYIDRDELKQLILDCDLNVDKINIDSIFDLIDTDKNNYISKDELIDAFDSL